MEQHACGSVIDLRTGQPLVGEQYSFYGSQVDLDLHMQGLCELLESQGFKFKDTISSNVRMAVQGETRWAVVQSVPAADPIQELIQAGGLVSVSALEAMLILRVIGDELGKSAEKPEDEAYLRQLKSMVSLLHAGVLVLPDHKYIVYKLLQTTDALAECEVQTLQRIQRKLITPCLASD